MENEVYNINEIKLTSDLKANKTTLTFGEHSVDICFEDMKAISHGLGDACYDINKVKKPQVERRHTSTGDIALIRGVGERDYHLDIVCGDDIFSFVVDADNAGDAYERFYNEYSFLNDGDFCDAEFNGVMVYVSQYKGKRYVSFGADLGYEDFEFSLDKDDVRRLIEKLNEALEVL